MKNEVAIKVTYSLIGISDTEVYGEAEVDSFRNNIQHHYIVTFHKNQAELGGGHFIIEFLLGITLKDYLLMILGGAAWDLVKLGTQKFFIRPFIAAYEQFRQTPGSHEIRDIAFTFADTKLTILSIRNHDVEVSFGLIGQIFQRLTLAYNRLDSEPHNKLIEITVPIFKDSRFTSSIYREKLPFDEPLESELFTEEAYFKFWGLKFFNYSRKVFDLELEKIIDSKWSTAEEFGWDEQHGNVG